MLLNQTRTHSRSSVKNVPESLMRMFCLLTPFFNFQTRRPWSGQWLWHWCRAPGRSNWFAESRTRWPRTLRSSGERGSRPSPSSRANTKSEPRGKRDNIFKSSQWSWHSFRIIPNTREIHLIPLSPRSRPRLSLCLPRQLTWCPSGQN